MNKLYSVTLAAGLALSTVGCVNASPSIATAVKLDTKKVCSVEASGIKSVLDTAAQYNAIAKKEGVEYRRLGMTTTQYIDGANAALKSGSKTVVTFK